MNYVGLILLFLFFPQMLAMRLLEEVPSWDLQIDCLLLHTMTSIIVLLFGDVRNRLRFQVGLWKQILTMNSLD